MTPEPNSISPKSRILVIDDNVDAAWLVSLSLKLNGYTVQCGDSGLQALSIAQAWHPQAIILDIGMPGMDGYETCQRLRQQPWGQSVVLIALTGYGQAEDRQRSRAAGFDAHLVKPADMTVLLTMLADLLNRSAKRADL